MFSNSIATSARPAPASSSRIVEPSKRDVVSALVIALAFVLITRLPVARAVPIESDEFGYLEIVRNHWFPIHHTLFLTLGRLCGLIVGNPYRGFILLDIVMSGLALAATWWWLRAIASPKVAAAATLLLGVGPIFWGYGAIAATYPVVIVAASLLLGIALRTWREPKPWHPYSASLVFAFGSGYRSDFPLFLVPVFGVILWKHRWKRGGQAALVCAALTLIWAVPMFLEAGSWNRYEETNTKFAHNAGLLNSVWNLGMLDGAVRYSIKLAMALVWTLGPALLFVPRGIVRLRRSDDSRLLAILLAISILPALATHLLLHFGSSGYAFYYIPALLALIVLGIGPASSGLVADTDAENRKAIRLLGIAGSLALVFWFYPTNYDRPGWLGNHDLAFARYTRAGLSLPMEGHQVAYWRTANSRIPDRPNPR